MCLGTLSPTVRCNCLLGGLRSLIWNTAQNGLCQTKQRSAIAITDHVLCLYGDGCATCCTNRHWAAFMVLGKRTLVGRSFLALLGFQRIREDDHQRAELASGFVQAY